MNPPGVRLITFASSLTNSMLCKLNQEVTR